MWRYSRYRPYLSMLQWRPAIHAVVSASCKPFIQLKRLGGLEWLAYSFAAMDAKRQWVEKRSRPGN
tara:strand:+ start:4971 stop:5168 length:198 start_codon:yes stop_codon:yes gene_type:complete